MRKSVLGFLLLGACTAFPAARSSSPKKPVPGLPRAVNAVRAACGPFKPVACGRQVGGISPDSFRANHCFSASGPLAGLPACKRQLTSESVARGFGYLGCAYQAIPANATVWVGCERSISL